MSAMTGNVLLDTKTIWALDLGGRKTHGPATMVETRTDDYVTPPWGLSGVHHVRPLPQRLIVHFLGGELEVKCAAETEEALDRMIKQEKDETHKAKLAAERRERAKANKVKITDLVGHVIRKVQMDERTIIFTLEDEHVWAFDNLYGVWDQAVEKPWILSNSGTITEVEAKHGVMVFTDRPGYLTIPAIIESISEDEEDWLEVGDAYEPSEEKLRTLPVIAERG